MKYGHSGQAVANGSAHVSASGGRVAAVAVAGGDGYSLRIGDQRRRNHGGRDSPAGLFFELGFFRSRGGRAQGRRRELHADAGAGPFSALQERLYGYFRTEGV